MTTQNAPHSIFDYGLTPTLDSDISSYADLMASLKQPAFRSKQLAKWLWEHQVTSYDEMSNMPTALRAQLQHSAPLQRATVTQMQQSSDGTRKYLIQFADGVQVEAVGLPALADSRGNSDRLTVCLSVQAGCALRCSFCATGQAGLTRNLLPGEIAEQVRIVGSDFGRRVTNVVVMGQGEAFQNYDASLAALRILNAPACAGGFGIGARHITLSTAGIIKGIEALSAEPEQFTLAVSLHSAVQETRNQLMPGLVQHNLDRLRQVLVEYYQRTNRRPSLEYALIEKVNTGGEQLIALIDFARATHAHVNLIPLNPTAASAQHHLGSAGDLAAMHTANTLRGAGIPVTVRQRRGADIDAACGQLVNP